MDWGASPNAVAGGPGGRPDAWRSGLRLAVLLNAVLALAGLGLQAFGDHVAGLMGWGWTPGQADLVLSSLGVAIISVSYITLRLYLGVPAVAFAKADRRLSADRRTDDRGRGIGDPGP